MRIVDPFYAITISIISVGVALLLYMKFYLIPNDVLSVTIHGSNFQAVLFAFYLHNLQELSLNITLVGSMKPELSKYIWPADHTTPSLHSTYIDKRILHFCGEEPLLMQFLEDVHLQYKIKRSEIVFSAQPSPQLPFSETIYHLHQEQHSLNAFMEYGFSHLSAQSVFSEFYSHITTGIPHNQLHEKSIADILDIAMLGNQKVVPNGYEYLSEGIGLDQKYIRDYAQPILSTQNSMNSVATLFKLLPLFCPSEDEGETSKNLALLVDERTIMANLLLRMVEKSQNRFRIVNKTMVDLRTQDERVELRLTSENESSEMQTDMLFIVEDYEESDKQLSYYKTIVDGVIPNDKSYEEVYTIYIQDHDIFSITRLCFNYCKNFRNYAYMLISKNKLNEQDLTMFQQHQIITYKKCWKPKTQQPSSQFQQIANVYRITDTEAISDHYQLKLLIIRNLVNMVKQRYSHE